MARAYSCGACASCQVPVCAGPLWPVQARCRALYIYTIVYDECFHGPAGKFVSTLQQKLLSSGVRKNVFQLTTLGDFQIWSLTELTDR